jgi:cell division protein ZapD
LNARIYIKSDVIREIERILSGLDKLETVKTVDQERLHSITEKLRQEMSSTHAISGPLGAHLKDHEFFNVLRQRGSVPGGINSFDLPQYHHWLCYPAEVRQTHLLAWIMPYEKINRSIGVILTLIRESSEKRPHLAQQGFYQHMLDPRHPHLMLRIWLTKSSALYPEVSSGKHRFNIRFLEIQDMATRPQQTGIDVNFELMCCTL